ncbi:MAG: glycoside hydrolase family 88 protein [Pontiellaceae bacterium]|nr:glycoside hydrolase family 88 protein [Pontiellaceae bacterium]
MLMITASATLFSGYGQEEGDMHTGESTTVEQVKMAMLCTQKYSWEFGVAMQGLIEIGDERNLVIMAREAVQRSTPDGRLAMVGSEKNIADTGVNGPALLAAYKITGDQKYKQAAQAQYDFLMLPSSRNSNGTIFHNTKSPVIFSDNLFMVAPFLAQMGDFDEAMRQIEAIRRVLWNEKEKLFHHIRIEETGEFKDKSFWGGGVGWCAAAMATVIDLLPDDRKADKEKLIQYTTEVLDGCLAHQLPSGLFYNKITEPDFEETTLPCMLAFTIYKGVQSGWLNPSYLGPADRMRAAAYAHVDEYGLLQNASAAPRFNSPGTSTEGQAFFLMMEGSYRKMNRCPDKT